MADNAWLLIHELNEITYEIETALYAENQIAHVRDYRSSGPDDPRAAVGVLAVIIAPNGSAHYVTETMAEIGQAVKAKVV